MLVLLGATPDGQKVLIAIKQVGVRESAEAWRELCSMTSSSAG